MLSLSKPARSILIDVCIIFIVFGLDMAITPSKKGNIMTIPVDNNSTLNTLFSYPLNLQGTLCWPSDLSLCTQSGAIQSKCCTLALDPSIFPLQTVPIDEVVLIVFLIPIAYFLTRSYLYWRSFRPLLSSSHLALRSEVGDNPRIVSTARLSLPKNYWLLLVLENVVGLLWALLIQWVVVDIFKLIIGAPRPIFYSLQYWSDLVPTLRAGLARNTHLSFPSGHSSTAASGMGYLFCIFLEDAEYLRGVREVLSRFLRLASLLCLLYPCWVGATRITDYWHFYWDVIGKLLTPIHIPINEFLVFFS